MPIDNEAQQTHQPSSSSCTEHVKVILTQEPKKDERVILKFIFFLKQNQTFSDTWKGVFSPMNLTGCKNKLIKYVSRWH